jgi:hypothetical protein
MTKLGQNAAMEVAQPKKCTTEVAVFPRPWERTTVRELAES